MLISADQIAALLQALGLSQSIFKPIPGLVGGVTSTVDGVLNTLDGITGGLGLPLPPLAPLLGSLLDVDEKTDGSSAQIPQNFPADYVQNLDADSCNVEPYNPPQVIAQTFPPFDQEKANVFRYRQQQSVNMGSWFVHEQWMTPSLFTCASGPQIAEIDIATGWGNTTAARAVLERHWDTFINQSDFEYLASIGINTVRLPIGYWSLGPVYCQGTPFEPVADVYTNSWSRVLRAINWAGEAGVGVLVDLHGAPGSQNGQAHSGISDGQVNFFNDTNMDLTINVLTFLTEQFATVTNVIGIEILNEPNDDSTLPDFYTRAITTMRQVSPEAVSLPIYIHDAFNLNQFSDFVAKRTDFVVEDHHSYFVFTAQDAARNASQDTVEVQSDVSSELATASQNQRGNLIVGEWSCAMEPSSLNNYTNPLAIRQQFCQGQEQVYANTTAGWHFWSYTKEDCETDLDWCFKNAVGNTLPSLFGAFNTSMVTTPEQSMSLARAVSEMELPSMTEVLNMANNQTPDSTSAASGVTTTTTSSLGAPSSSDASSTSSQINSKRSTHAYNRFSAIHSRRFFHSDISKHRRDNVMPTASASPPSSLTSIELSITKGYSDGFLTAKIFAQYGQSKLGFVSQYILDSISTLGPSTVAPGTENYYTAWFNRGLSDAQLIISAAAGS